MKPNLQVIFLFLFLSFSAKAHADYISSIEQIATTLFSPLKQKTVAIGLIKEKNSGKHLKLSDQIADDLSIELKNRQIKVVVSDENLKGKDLEHFRAGVVTADTLIVGTFQKWGDDYSLTVQAVDVRSGNILGGKTVKIPQSDIPANMLKPAEGTKIITGKGVASINYQCLDNEKPCPPLTVLKRRAVRVAKLAAYQDISEKSGVPLHTLTSVENGRLKANTVQTSTNKTLAEMKFQEPVIEGDELSIEVSMEVE